MQSETKTLYSYISKYRSEIMGVSILFVVWFHSQFYLDFFPTEGVNNFFQTLKSLGYGGVDVFLFLSGLGIYNSLAKNSLSVYFKNRIKRIIPAWWINLLVTTLITTLYYKMVITPREIIGAATLTGFWVQMQNQGDWYVPFIVMIYLVAPVLASLIRDSKHRFITLVIMLTVTLAASSVFWNSQLLIAVSRVPIFIIGLYISSERDKIEMNWKSWLITVIVFTLGVLGILKCLSVEEAYRWAYALWWYPFLLIAPSFALLLALLFDKTQRPLKYLYKLLAVLGQSSLEILVISDYLLGNIWGLIPMVVSFRLYVLFTIVLSIVLGVGLHFAIEKCISIVESKL